MITQNSFPACNKVRNQPIYTCRSYARSSYENSGKCFDNVLHTTDCEWNKFYYSDIYVCCIWNLRNTYFPMLRGDSYKYVKVRRRERREWTPRWEVCQRHIVKPPRLAGWSTGAVHARKLLFATLLPSRRQSSNLPTTLHLIATSS